MSDFTYSISCSKTSALLPVYLGLTYEVSLVIQCLDQARQGRFTNCIAVLTAGESHYVFVL